MKKGALLALCCLMSASLYAQDCVKVSAAKLNDYGLTYNLPKTQIDIEVKATRITTQSGPYCNYAAKYLGIPVAITENSDYWELNSISATTSGVADKSEEYIIRFKPNIPVQFCLDENGVLLSVNEDPAGLTPAPAETPAVADSSAEKVTEEKSAFSVLSEEVLLSGSTSKMAEVAAKQIYRIRDSRLNLLTGEVDQLPADGESFKIVMGQLDAQEKALTALFLGERTKKEHTFHLSIVPEEAVNHQVLFRFSEQLGMVEADNLAGVPIFYTIDIKQEGVAPVDEKGRTKPMPKNGLVYTIPGEAVVKLDKNGEPLFEQVFPFAQFGTKFSLNPSLFKNKKSVVKVQFAPETGAIRSIEQ